MNHRDYVNKNYEAIRIYQKDYQKKWRKENKEKIKEYRKKNGKEYRFKRKNKIDEYSKKYRENNREMLRIKARDRYIRKLSEDSEKIKKYRENITKRNIHNERDKISSFSLSLRFLVLKRDKFTCQYCGRKAPVVILQVDHIIPESKGGKTIIENLITACEECNRGKYNNLL
jgi:5-methylcytosine-specific restriction endonuclease McrA